MNQQLRAYIDLLRATRKNILSIYNDCSPEQLNEIPPGFNNNLVWNAGHVVATMELLVYGLSGLKTPSDKAFIDRYRKGARPEGPVSQQACDQIAERLTSGIDWLENDLQALDFSEYKTYTTSYGVTLASVPEALAFNNMHEAMHLGTMIALKKLVA